MIVERLKEYIDYKSISVHAFERSVGLGSGTFMKALKNNGAIGSDKLETIFGKYSELNPLWVIKGEGSMVSSESSQDDIEDYKETIRELRADLAYFRHKVIELEGVKGDIIKEVG